MRGAMTERLKDAARMIQAAVVLIGTLLAACEEVAPEREDTAWAPGPRDAANADAGRAMVGSGQPSATTPPANSGLPAATRDAGVAHAAADMPDSSSSASPKPADAAVGMPKLDPGTAAWVPVPSEQVQSVCRLDPEALARADEMLDTPWLAVRYGRLCHAYRTEQMVPDEAFSAAKILGAVVTGAVAYQTRDLVKHGPKTGPFSDTDRVDAWSDEISYNPEARVAHVLAMVAQSEDLSPGKRWRKYDDLGWIQLDSLGPMLNAAIAQDEGRLGANLDPFVKQFIFGPLGMTQSTWSDGFANKAFGWTWVTTPLDMARLGLLILRGGVWNDQRIIAEDWAYRMTHPAFEDADTGFGYCTWLNASSNWTLGEVPTPEAWQGDVGKRPHFPGSCAPVSVNRQHPHGLSEWPDCNYAPPYTCEQTHDVGVWQSVAGFGKVIQGHPGLDLLLVGWDITPDDFHAMPSAEILWNAVRPAVIAADPKFRGDEAGFCAAYGSNNYAPDL